MIWRKSSRRESSACVEIAWRKSSRSSDSFNCVEMSATGADVMVRDSKDPAGPVLSFAGADWRAFIAGAKAGEFDLG